MRNKRGAIKLITLIEIILILVAILYGIIFYNKYMEKKHEKSLGLNGNEVDNSTLNMFSIKFLQLENSRKNLIYSPLSIKYALRMLQDGASSNTYDQIKSFLEDDLLPEYSNKENKISMANGIFIGEGYTKYIKKDFTDILDKYNAEIKFDTFENANNMNKWIQEKTFGLIQNVIEDKAIQESDKKMVLLNSLAIDGEWEKQFSFETTTGQPFTLSDGTETTVTMMEQDIKADEASYYLGKDLTALTMDLKDIDGVKLEFMAIMPNSDLKEYIRQFTKEEISYISSQLKSSKKEKNGIKIQIPKFSIDYSLNLKDDLKKTGIKDMFGEKTANFSQIADFQTILDNLYVEEAIHKSKIDFSEKGIKDASVTTFGFGVDTNFIGGKTKKEVVKINRPFLFFIRNKNTKEIWFTGTVYEPNLWENDMEKYQTDLY